MKLKVLQLHQFRNYKDLKISFNDKINIFYGNNAQGKTNLLESIYFISTNRTHRSNHDVDLIKEGCDYFYIDALIKNKYYQNRLKVVVNKQGKSLFINHDRIKKVSDFIGNLNAILFTPDDLNLFNTTPKVRRRFIDIELSKISKHYMGLLNEIYGLIKERNAILKQNRVDKLYIQVIDEKLCELECIIIKQRYHFIRKLLIESKIFYNQLAIDHSDIDLVYDSCIDYDEDVEVMKNNLLRKYQDSFEKDCKFKSTSIGIHKEDYEFLINNQNVGSYASQGQKRSMILAFKIGMIYLIKKMIDEDPILLLDDVFSELDENRRKLLLDSLPDDIQIFITTTDPIYENKDDISLWHVSSGNIQLRR